MKIIGITGTNSAGKGEVVEYFKKKGFAHFSARAFIAEEIQKRGIPLNRENASFVGSDLRQKNSPSYILEQLYLQAQKSGKDSIVESVRSLGEVAFLKQQPFFTLLAVDADRKLRYERAKIRKSALDNVTYEQFVAEEEREMGSTNLHEMNILGCIKQADFLLMNNGTIEELHNQIDAILPKILGKE